MAGCPDPRFPPFNGHAHHQIYPFIRFYVNITKGLCKRTAGVFFDSSLLGRLKPGHFKEVAAVSRIIRMHFRE